jgi:tRNA 2-thiouridine synthesizing protein E
MRIEENPARGVTAPTGRNQVIDLGGGKYVEVDPEGFLLDPSAWTRECAEWMAAADGIALGDDHWLLIDFLHRFFVEYGLAPTLQVLARNLCKDQKDCRWTRRYIRELFPGGASTACRYAGLPAPLGNGCL